MEYGGKTCFSGGLVKTLCRIDGNTARGSRALLAVCFLCHSSLFFCFLAVILFCFHSGTVLFGSDSFPGQVGVLTNTKQSFFSHEALALAHVIGPRPEFRALVGSREGLTMLLRAGYGHGNVEEGGAGMMGGSGKRRHTRGMFGRGSSEAGNERDLWRGHVLGPVE